MAFKGSEMRISMYDKTREQTKHNGDVVRVEVQLKGRVLKELLGGGERVTRLDFNTCYQAYRSILLGFDPSPIPDASNIARLLAIGELEHWHSNGISQFEIYTRDMSERNVRRLQHDMASFRPAVHQIDWSELLPADGPPPAVEVEENS